MMGIIYFAAAFAALVLASGYAVDAAQRLAKRIGVSEMAIGLTIAAVGTSLPEIMTNVMSGLRTRAGVDASGIAVGNIIGADMAKITLVLGLTGFISIYVVPMKSLRRDGLMALAAWSAMFLAASDGSVTAAEGLLLVAFYVAYIAYLLSGERVFGSSKTAGPAGIAADAAKAVAALAVVVYSADYIVAYAIDAAAGMNLSESLVGIFLGLGTSLPELAVSSRAMLKRASDLSLGNLIGSCICDPLLSFGLGAAVGGVSVAASLLRFDFVYWLCAEAIALLLLWDHKDLTRKESAALLIVYFLFIYLRISFFPA
jgi:cation:H+ antiporter